MTHILDEAGVERLEAYFGRVGGVLGDDRRRASFAMYAMGLMGDGERKSLEPIAARAYAEPRETERAHDRLLHSMTDSRWNDRDVRRIAATHAIEAMTAREPIRAWIVDDTCMLKQGTHSVGARRQYTGSAGKVTNCQLAVTLTVASKTAQAPVDAELYLPHSWTDDAARRHEARIPGSIAFRTKPTLALEMIRRAVDDHVPGGVVLADSAYGDENPWRQELRSLELDYAVGVKATTKVWLLDRLGRPSGDALSVNQVARRLGRKRFRRVTWRQATRGPLWSSFARVRVITAHDDGWLAAQREPQWLLIEWPDDEREPTHYTLSTLGQTISAKQLVRLVKERYRTERVYEDLKGELGFDHCEGRRFPGWHHHVSVVLCCFAFIVAEQQRRFPPSARRQARPHAQLRAA